MTEGDYMMGFYTSISPILMPERLVRTLEHIGFDVRATEKLFRETSTHEYVFRLPFNEGSILVSYNTNPKRKPAVPAVTLFSLRTIIVPSLYDDEKKYQQRMDELFEMVCRLAVALEVEYAVLVNPADRGKSVTPSGRPIVDSIEQHPRLGVYADSVLEDAGGIDSLFETMPWYTADLEGERTVVLESGWPWAEGSWRPPTDASFIKNARFYE